MIGKQDKRRTEDRMKATIKKIVFDEKKIEKALTFCYKKDNTKTFTTGWDEEVVVH